MKSKPHRLLQHFSPILWLCEALDVLRFLLLSIRKLFKHSRILITHLYTLEINLTLRSHFLHSNCTIPLLIHCRSLTLQALVRDESYLCFLHLFACLNQKCDFSSKLHVVSHITMIIPQTICHVHALTYVPWAL